MSLNVPPWYVARLVLKVIYMYSLFTWQTVIKDYRLYNSPDGTLWDSPLLTSIAGVGQKINEGRWEPSLFRMVNFVKTQHIIIINVSGGGGQGGSLTF